MNNLGNKQIMAKNIKYYLNLHGITQSQICTTLNIPMPTFSDWVNAKTYPRIDKIEMLSNYFGIDKSDLVEEKKNKTESYNPLTTDQEILIHYYNDTDNFGRDSIMSTAEREYNRAQSQQKKPPVVYYNQTISPQLMAAQEVSPENVYQAYNADEDTNKNDEQAINDPNYEYDRVARSTTTPHDQVELTHETLDNLRQMTKNGDLKNDYKF